MQLRQKPLMLTIALALLVGCTMSPLFIIERPMIERSLPKGIAMTDYVETDWFGTKVTVEEKLARLGAYAEYDGTIRDGTGREIRIMKHEDKALKPDPVVLRREQEAMRDLKARCTIIEVSPEPDAAKPADGTAKAK